MYAAIIHQDNQIRLTRQALSDEVIFFLEPKDKAKIHNRMVKYNLGITVSNSLAFLRVIFKPDAPIKALIDPNTNRRLLDYHGEIPRKFMIVGSILDTFIKKLVTYYGKKPLPKGYRLFHIGVNLNNHADGKGKLGNLEIKYVKEDAVIVPGENPDPMIILNIHVNVGKNNNFQTVSDVKQIENSEKFLNRAINYFKLDDNEIIEMMISGNKIRNNFSSSGHRLTTDNLAYHYYAKKVKFPEKLVKEVEERNKQRVAAKLPALPIL